MSVLKRLLRIRQSKGYGVHSPFAFNLITEVIYSPYSYYAFSDILKVVGHDPDKEQNQISFKLVNHFKPDNILEIHSGDGAGSLYILSPSWGINYTSVVTEEKNISYLKESISNYLNSREHYSKASNFNIVTSFEEIIPEKFDAIFINLDCGDNFLSSLDRLFEISNENTFWVINHINKKMSKQLWRHIVNDARIGVTFDFKNRTGVAFLRSAYHKQHYRV
ncbi:MAG: hypothetical protein PHR52_03780 [Fermentimonas sp.]|nr:hypothetical protein [Fermentimonas sp.]